MNAQVLQFSQTFERVADCCTCGVALLMSNEMQGARRRDHATFYCINGHPNFWPQKASAIAKKRAIMFQIEMYRSPASPLRMGLMKNCGPLYADEQRNFFSFLNLVR